MISLTEHFTHMWRHLLIAEAYAHRRKELEKREGRGIYTSGTNPLTSSQWD